MPTRENTVDPLGAPPLGQEHAYDSVDAEVWRNEIADIFAGKLRRQRTIDAISGAKVLPDGLMAFLICDQNGNAVFNVNGDQLPYIGPGFQLIVPQMIIASQRQIANVAAFRAIQVVQQDFVSGVPATVDFNSLVFEQNTGDFDLSTDRFTPTLAGVYAIGGAIGFDASVVVADKYVSVGIAKNGTTIASAVGHTSATEDIVVHTAVLVEMNGTTDYITLAAEHNFGANALSYGNEYTCNLYGHKVN